MKRSTDRKSNGRSEEPFGTRGESGSVRNKSQRANSKSDNFAKRSGSRKQTPRPALEKSSRYNPNPIGLPIQNGEAGELIRLNKFIGLCGEASRRKADSLIESGDVTVNGKTVTELGFKIRRYKDRVAVMGKDLVESEKKLYILLNKPKDAITTNSDERGRTTVLDIVGIEERVYAVGRLDRQTTGALLLTNDGELATRLMHPSYGVQKEYIAELDKKISGEDAAKLRMGMRLKDTGDKVQPAKAEILGDGYAVWISIHEGKNRQVHRMFYNIGYDVKKLERISYAGLKPSGLRRGEWRNLTADEVRKLYKFVKLESPY